MEQSNQAKNGEFRPTIDVYALGGTFYKLLTGQTPPPASDLVSDDELLTQKLQQKGIEESLISSITKCMIPNVRKRTQTIRTFLDSITSVKNVLEEGIQQVRTEEIPNSSEETQIIENPLPNIDGKRNKKKSNRPLFIVVLFLAFVGIVAYFSYGSSKKNVYEAELKDEIDTVSYTIGLAQSRGIKEYLVERMGVDTAYIDYFIEGLSTGAECGDNKDSIAYYSGIQIGQQISQQTIKSINYELYGNDTTKTISLRDFLDGFTAGSTGNNQLMTVEQAVEKSQRLMEEAKEQHRKDSIAKLK